MKFIEKFFKVQPAYRIYVFGRGWRVLIDIVRKTFQRNHKTALWWLNKAKSFRVYSTGQNAFKRGFFWVYVVGFYLLIGVLYVLVMIFAFLSLLIHSIGLVLGVVLSMVLMILLAIATSVYVLIEHINTICPDCHKHINLIFICPKCSKEHSQLWPSIYGILSHRCECGERLSAIDIKIGRIQLGENRDKLERICSNPECATKINPGVGKLRNFHIHIVGGPSTGKSNLIIMATKVFIETYKNKARHSVTFPDKKHEDDYNENVKRFEEGRELVKTTDMVAHAYNLEIQSPKARLPRIVYVYDAAGDIYYKKGDVEKQEYYKYLHGLIFTIDPFSIPSYQRDHEADILPYRNLIRPSDLNIMQAYDNMFSMFAEFAKLRKDGRYSHPFAVVVTKVDALNLLKDEIGVDAANRYRSNHPKVTEGDAISTLVREFLCRNGLDNFVDEVELQFSKVRYFSCSALGRLPDVGNRTSFKPDRASDPLVWLLTQTKAI